MDPFLRKRDKIELVVDNDPVLGGKTPPVGGIDWLRNVSIGSVFLVKEKNSYSYRVRKYVRLSQMERNVTLLYVFNGYKVITVDNVRYCNTYEYICTIGIYYIAI